MSGRACAFRDLFTPTACTPHDLEALSCIPPCTPHTLPTSRSSSLPVHTHQDRSNNTQHSPSSGAYHPAHHTHDHQHTHRIHTSTTQSKHLPPHTHHIHLMTHHLTPPLLPIVHRLITLPGPSTECDEACQVIKMCPSPPNTHTEDRMQTTSAVHHTHLVHHTCTRTKFIHTTHHPISTSVHR